MGNFLEPTDQEAALIGARPNGRRLTIQGKDQPETQDYIEVFGILPDYLLKINGIIISEQDDESLRVLLSTYRGMFKATKKWLEYFERNQDLEQIVKPKVIFSDWEQDFKPHGEFSWALLKLCQEIFKIDSRSKMNPVFADFLSGAELWFNYVLENLETAFQTNGIFGSLRREGKQKSLDLAMRGMRDDLNNLFEIVRDLKLPQKLPPQVPIINSTEKAIEMYAQTIAQKDCKFREIYETYKKTQIRSHRAIRNDSNFQSGGLNNNGSLWIGGKGRRGKDNKKRRKRGFGKQK